MNQSEYQKVNPASIPNPNVSPAQSYKEAPIEVQEKPGPGIPWGLIMMSALVLIILGFGIFFFFQNSKVSAEELPPLDKQIDYDLSPVYTFVSTIGWNEEGFDGFKIKYPPEWQLQKSGSDKTVLLGNSAGMINFSQTENSPDKTCKDSLKKATEVANTNNRFANRLEADSTTSEKGITTIQGIKVDFVLNRITMQAVSWKNLHFCFNKDGKEYGGLIQEQGADRKLKNLKQYILILNSLEFN